MEPASDRSDIVPSRLQRRPADTVPHAGTPELFRVPAAQLDVLRKAQRGIGVQESVAQLRRWYSRSLASVVRAAAASVCRP